MPLKLIARSSLILFFCILLPKVLHAEEKLPSLFSNGMMLQRDVPVPIWGSSDPGEKIRITFLDQHLTCHADEKGMWQAYLSPMKSGTSGDLTITGKNKTVIRDVLLGDIWICSGQSNMEWPVISATAPVKEIRQANHPDIRLFVVEKKVSSEPLDEAGGCWKKCSPEAVGAFSAVGYFFGRHIHETMNIPVGLIQSTWGGTPAESWTPLEKLMADPDLTYLADNLNGAPENRFAVWCEARKNRNKHIGPLGHEDEGNRGHALGWADPDLKDSDWDEMILPDFFEHIGLIIDGAVWFRKAVDLPLSWHEKGLLLEMGVIDDSDITYFNGEQVGATVFDKPKHPMKARKYHIPPTLVRGGRNEIAVRVFDMKQKGGFGGKPDSLRLVCGKETRPLQGTWKYRVESMLNPAQYIHRSTEGQYMPSALFNGMVAPLTRMPVKGVIWYQGEANDWKAFEYRKLFPALIEGWRTAWGMKDLPFLFVQLTGYRKVQPYPGPSQWAELREAQRMTLALPGTGMAVAIDLGEAEDIHPKNKLEVGQRLALVALAQVYKKDLVHSGPVNDSMMKEGQRIRIRFKHAEGGLITKGSPEPEGFAIAGEDGKFVWAKAEIQGNCILLWNEQVKAPMAVRYGWADNPRCNLYNRAGLPACPFRTDHFPGITINNR